MTDAANKVTLRIGSQEYGGWERLEVQRSIEQVAGGFVLQLTHRWPKMQEIPPLREGLACEVRIGDDLVITGYVDLFEPDLDEQSSTIRVEGRDKTGDLVDCSAVFGSGQWRNVRLEKIVADIAKPFGIGVTVKTSTGEVFRSFALEDGERAFDAIDRACRLRAVMCTSSSTGDLVLDGAGEIRAEAELVEGVNIKRIAATHTWKERHSVITIKGQSPGDDLFNGDSAAHQAGKATDPEITRYRPLVVQAEHGTSSASLKERAAWEVAVRMGRGKRGRCTVAGWRTGPNGQTGPLWQPNTLVRIRSPRMHLDQDMLIVGVSYALTEKGSSTELVFARREAFALQEGIKRSKLRGKLNDRTQKEKHKRGDALIAPWDLEPPKVVR